MNNDVEQRLREALRVHGEDAPTGTTMLESVRGEATRRSRRFRRTTMLAGVVVAVLVVAAGGYLIRPAGHRSGPTVGFGASGPGASGAPGPDPATATVPSGAVVSLARGMPLHVDFPFTLPGSGAVAALAAGDVTLRGGNLGSTWVWVHNGNSAPTVGSGTVTFAPVTIRGRAGVKAAWVVGTSFHAIYWQERPGLWVVVQGYTADTLLATANALAPGVTRGVVPYRFDTVPAGFPVDNVTSSDVTFRPPGVPFSEGFLNAILVTVSADRVTGVTEQPVRVGARHGWLRTDDNTVFLEFESGDGRYITIQETTAARLTTGDLVRFAAGIHINPQAQSGQG